MKTPRRDQVAALLMKAPLTRQQIGRRLGMTVLNVDVHLRALDQLGRLERTETEEGRAFRVRAVAS